MSLSDIDCKGYAKNYDSLFVTFYHTYVRMYKPV